MDALLIVGWWIVVTTCITTNALQLAVGRPFVVGSLMEQKSLAKAKRAT